MVLLTVCCCIGPRHAEHHRLAVTDRNAVHTALLISKRVLPAQDSKRLRRHYELSVATARQSTVVIQAGTVLKYYQTHVLEFLTPWQLLKLLFVLAHSQRHESGGLFSASGYYAKKIQTRNEQTINATYGTVQMS
jgi:hypothetical protein